MIFSKEDQVGPCFYPLFFKWIIDSYLDFFFSNLFGILSLRYYGWLPGEKEMLEFSKVKKGQCS